MKWNYICPHCNQLRKIDWKEREVRYLCHKDQTKKYYPPNPEEQKNAFVDTHNWPVEMERVVVSEKGNICTVPGCSKKYQTLDHRKAFSKGGKTSVDNLFPICDDHNRSKSDEEYTKWLKSL